MTLKPRTIDQLGIDTSIRYAKDQQLLDPKLIEESRWIPQKAETSVMKPYVPTDFDPHYMGEKGGTIWALFSPPPGYFTGGRLLFTYQLIPSLRNFETQEGANDHLTELEEALQKPRKRKKKNQDDDSPREEEEKESLLELLRCIKKLDGTLALINGRRNQYQRG